jgi:hypothetical protein
MTISETIKHAVGLEAGPSTRTFLEITRPNCTWHNHLDPARAQTTFRPATLLYTLARQLHCLEHHADQLSNSQLLPARKCLTQDSPSPTETPAPTS